MPNKNSMNWEKTQSCNIGKYISGLLYGFEACTLTKSELSLDFTVHRFF